MKNIVLLLCSVALNTNLLAVSKPDISAYEKHAKAIISSNKKISSKEIINLSNKLINESKGFIQAFTEKKPECKEMLDATLKAEPDMRKSNVNDIEEKYGDGHKGLPKGPNKCLNAKEAMIHPMIVLSIANQKKITKSDRERIKTELEEVLGHMEAALEEWE